MLIFARLRHNNEQPFCANAGYFPGGSMDSKNPRRYEQFVDAVNHLDNAPTRGMSAEGNTPRLAESTFAYQSAHFTASVAPAVSYSHTEAVPLVGEPATAETTPEPPDESPAVVPVLSVQHITQPLTSSREPEPVYDEYEIAWSDDDQEHMADEGDEGSAGNEGVYEIPLNIADGIISESLSRDEAFALHERSFDGWKQLRKTLLILLAFTLILAVAVFGGAVAASYALRATQKVNITPKPTASRYNSGVVIQPDTGSTTPTPIMAQYQIGAWLSNNAPSGGSVKVFVRLTEDVAPVAKIPVTLAVQMPGGTVQLGPTNTDDYGLATFTVTYGGLSGTPVFVTATAKIDDTHEITADTVFVPV
jgi:hypothetical protein